MPLAWDRHGVHHRKRIPGYQNRAIKIRQLQDLSIYLQRLCKAGLLLYTSDRSRKKGHFGRRIAWSNLNMYVINTEVIMKVIPFWDPYCEICEITGQRWYSWVEFLAKGQEQIPKVFFSHWWGGHFRDFMQVVDHTRKDYHLSIHDGIWICTFALCQFGDDLGSSLDCCPFVHGLSMADNMVLVVDRIAGSLTRTWCGFELQMSAKLHKNLDLYAPTGRVGANKGASSVALLDAVEKWDIRATESSNAADRRQIFNYVAELPELGGLAVDEEGRPLMVDGHKRLENEDLDPKGRQRGHKCKPEYAYEMKIFEDFEGKFSTLNRLVQSKVRSSLGHTHASHGRLIETAAFRGLPLGLFRAFVRTVKRHHRFKWSTLTVADMADYVWKKRYEIHGQSCSYLEKFVEEPIPPVVYVNYASSGKFEELVQCVEWQAEARAFDDSTALFLDFLCLREDEQRIHGATDTNFATAAEESQGILIVHGCNRAWVLLDLATFLVTDKFVDLGGCNGVLACTRPLKDGGWEYGEYSKHELRAMLKLRVDSVQLGSCSEDNMEAVRNHIADTFRHAGRDEAFSFFEECLRRFAAGPLLRGAVFDRDFAFLRKFCETPGMLMNSKSNRGALGEMPVHLAAASGDVEALRTCLDLKADPNSEDAMLERPLHYAALAGSAHAVQVLLRNNADPCVRSSFLETPLDVAKDNAASYLGIDTALVVELLTSAESLERQLCDALPETKAVTLTQRCSTATQGWWWGELSQQRTIEEGLELHRERSQATTVSPRELEWIDRVVESFSKYDLDKSGYIARQDLRAVLAQLMGEEEAEAEKLLASLAPEAARIRYREFLEGISGAF